MPAQYAWYNTGIALKEGNHSAAGSTIGALSVRVMNARFPIARYLSVRGRSVALAVGITLSPEASELIHNVPPGTPSTSDVFPPKEFTFKSWQTEDGLPQATPTAMIQTADGYLWVGTFNGLSRFDGVRFNSFTMNNTPELYSDYIMALHEDSQGELWIGTGEGGLVRYGNGGFRAFALDGDTATTTVYAICGGRDGTVWVGTSDGLRAVTHDASGERVTMGKLFSGQPVTGIARAKQDEMWVSTPRTLHRVKGFEIVESFRAPDEIHTFKLDSKGSPWVSYAAGGIGWPDRPSGTLSWSRWRSKVNAMHLGKAGTLWGGTTAGQLVRIGRHFPNYHRVEAKLPDRIVVIEEDREGNVWAGVESRGLWRLRRSMISHLGTEEGLLTASITSLAEDGQGRIWAGTFGRGLHWWDGQRFTPMRMPLAPNVTSVLEDRNGRVWFGTYGGALRWVDEGEIDQVGKIQVEQQFGNRSRVLFIDREEGMWLGSMGEGVEHVRAGQVTRYGEEKGLSHGHVRAIAQDREGSIWVGTSKGLNRIRGGRIEQFHREHGLAGEQVRSLFVDSEGTLWVGATGGGLTRWKEGQLRAIGEGEGLIDDWIEQIIEDEHGHLWLGSNGGLMRVNLRELNECVSGRKSFVHCTAFRREEGMLLPNCGTGFQPSCLKTRDGKLWFATEAGMVVIDPAEVKPNESIPRVYIEAIRADQAEQSIPAEGELPLLKAGTQRLEFRYTGLDFTAPALVRFRYKLEGFDREWVNAGMRREAVYTGLPPGQYRFRVLASNNQGFWNEDGASVKFAIAPFFWQTGSFQLAAPAAGLLLAALGMRGLLVRRHRREVEVLEQNAALERERSRIAQDMHDGLGSSLVKISLLGEQAESRFSEPDHAQPQIRKITARARQVVREMDEIVWAVNPRNDTVENFGSYLCHFAQEHFCDTAVECRLDFPGQLPSLPLRAELRHNLFLASREALNNVLKHSGARVVCVRLEFAGGKLVIEVEDDGRGFCTATGKKGHGLENMRKRLQQIGGELRIEAGSEGTKVRFEISLDRGEKRVS